jgi:hypothetical protein
VSVGLFGYLELRSLVRTAAAYLRSSVILSKHLVVNKVPCVSDFIDVCVLTACALTFASWCVDAGRVGYRNILSQVPVHTL